MKKYLVNIQVYEDNGMTTEVLDAALFQEAPGPEQAIACAALQAVWMVEKQKAPTRDEVIASLRTSHTTPIVPIA